MNTPNKLTLLRILMVPVFIWCLYMNFNIAAIAVFIFASATDWLDGYLARKNGLVTNFGKLMDPLADKILIISALVCFLELDVRFLSSWMVIVIIARELIVTGIRLIALDEKKVIAASWWGKSKTVSQMLAVIALMVDRMIKLDIYNFSITAVLVWAMVILTVYSGFDYIRKNRFLIKLK